MLRHVLYAVTRARSPAVQESLLRALLHNARTHGLPAAERHVGADVWLPLLCLLWTASARARAPALRLVGWLVTSAELSTAPSALRRWRANAWRGGAVDALLASALADVPASAALVDAALDFGLGLLAEDPLGCDDSPFAATCGVLRSSPAARGRAGSRLDSEGEPPPPPPSLGELLS
ncbi:hypothetical protein T492DRAFT_369573 [Pavlovales sp. CCMP2436]|nr:hypothetical protein T492DRAFT_369573 [Pavlovales sp. CCMP2436]